LRPAAPEPAAVPTIPKGRTPLADAAVAADNSRYLDAPGVVAGMKPEAGMIWIFIYTIAISIVAVVLLRRRREGHI
jgi:hypothetical protein